MDPATVGEACYKLKLQTGSQACFFFRRHDEEMVLTPSLTVVISLHKPVMNHLL